MKQFAFIAAFIFFFVTQIMPNWDKLSAKPGGIVFGLLLAIGGALAIAHFTGQSLPPTAGKKNDEQSNGTANDQRSKNQQAQDASEQRPENKKGGSA